MATATTGQLSPAEYLEKERGAEFKSEYFQGQVTAMAGGTYQHSVIILNVGGELRQGLKHLDCTVSSSDSRLAVVSAELYTYPDVMVVCGNPVFADSRRDSVSNPILIAEVLSESTKAYDQGKKLQIYRTIPSLREYLTIAQNKIHVEQYVRQADNRWLLSDHTQREGSIQLAAVPFELQLAEIYAKIELEAK